MIGAYVTADEALAVVAAYGGDVDPGVARALAAEVHRLRSALAAAEAEARTALDALHARCDAAEAETKRLRAARLDDAARHATECVRWGERKVELLGRIVELEAALKAAQPALMLDAIRRGTVVMCCTHCSAEWPLDDAHCPGCGHPDRNGGAAPLPQTLPDIWCHVCKGTRGDAAGNSCATCRGTGRHPPPADDAPPEPDDPAGLFAAFDRMGVPMPGARYVERATGEVFEVSAAAPLAREVYLRRSNGGARSVRLDVFARDYRREDAPPAGNLDRAQLAALAGRRSAEAPDRDLCPTCGALDLDHAPEECARRWAEQHPGAAAGIVGACVAPKGEP